MIAGIPGLRTKADDSLIFGKGENVEEYTRDYDQKFRELMQKMHQCVHENQRLNGEKLKLRSREVPFILQVITAQGLKPKPGKVEALKGMPVPTDVLKVQRFLRFVNELIKILPM